MILPHTNPFFLASGPPECTTIRPSYLYNLPTCALPGGRPPLLPSNEHLSDHLLTGVSPRAPC